MKRKYDPSHVQVENTTVMALYQLYVRALATVLFDPPVSGSAMDLVGSQQLLEPTSPRRCVRYGTWALWFASWWGLKCLVVDQDASVYLLCMSLALHVRIPPPLGQVPPLMDPLLVYVQGSLAQMTTEAWHR
eukprot:s51_g24.t1